MSPLTIRLREFRERAGLSQVELARRAKTSQTTISSMELGKGRIIHLDILERVARALDISAGELLGEAAPPRRKKRGR